MQRGVTEERSPCSESYRENRRQSRREKHNFSPRTSYDDYERREESERGEDEYQRGEPTDYLATPSARHQSLKQQSDARSPNPPSRTNSASIIPHGQTSASQMQSTPLLMGGSAFGQLPVVNLPPGTTLPPGTAIP